MYYLWWLIAIFLYLAVLASYIILMGWINPDNESNRQADGIFFAIASVVTLSIIPLLKVNIYGEE